MISGPTAVSAPATVLLGLLLGLLLVLVLVLLWASLLPQTLGLRRGLGSGMGLGRRERGGKVQERDQAESGDPMTFDACF